MSVRLRLTLLYGTLFFVAGLLLIVLMYGLLSRSLDPEQPLRPFRGQGQMQGPPPNQQDEDDTDEQSFAERLADARSEERHAALRQIRNQSVFALFITGGGAVGLGWVVAGRVLNPVRDITLHAREASEKTLDQRIRLTGPDDELKHLADTIDDMLDRLQAAFESQRRFSAEASHELRTPLAIIRAEAEVALTAPDVTTREQELATSIIAAVDRAERLIDGLLALARSDSSLLDHDRVDLAELAGDVVGEQIRAANQAGITLDLDLETVMVLGDRALLWRLIGNLVENGLRHGVEGGWLTVSTGTEGALTVLTVANNGRVIAPGNVDKLFQPFSREAQSRRETAGHGLGLAIVKSVAVAHGGDVSASANPEGGLTVTVRFPGISAN